MKVQVSINSISKVKEFCVKVFDVPEDLDLMLDRFCVDAKSIMGIFSIDITQPLTLVIHTEDEGRAQEIKELVKEYIVE